MNDVMSASKAQAKAFSDAVEEMCKFLGEQFTGEVDKRLLTVDGMFAASSIDLEKRINHLKFHLSNYMRDVPREEGEALGAYRERLSMRDPRCSSVMHQIANLEAHLLGEARKAAGEHRRADEERKALERSQRAELERQASPDRDELRQLLEVIENARAGERFLAQLSDALNAHRNAEDARKRLHDIFDAQRRACASIGRKLPSQSKVPAAPSGACDIALVIHRANAPAPRIYGGGASAPAIRRG